MSSEHIEANPVASQIVSALKLRKRTILAEEKWKTVPWTLHEKRSKDKLLDILADTPSLREDFDTMKKCTDLALQRAQTERLLERCWSLESDLQKWYAETASEMIVDQQFFEDSTEVNLVQLAAAHLATTYSATCIILYSILRELVEPLAPLPARTELRPYARQIAKTASIFFHPRVGTYRQHLAPFPILIALRYISSLDPVEMQEERRWLDSCLAKPEGAMTRSFIQSMQRQQQRS